MSGMHDDDQHAAASFKTMSMSSLAPTSARGNQQRQNESTFFFQTLPAANSILRCVIKAGFRFGG